MSYAYMLDTNIVSSLMREPAGKVARRLEQIGDDAACMSIVSAAELRFGALRRGTPRLQAQIERVILQFPAQPFSPPADVLYAEIRTSLERAGTPIGPNDLFIAAHALALGLMLVTANTREFSRVPGLRLDNWLD